MTLQIRDANARGKAEHGWLSSRHSFSFADYYDPRHMGFRALRVINEDRVAPGKGFGTHPHRDMEIISYVIDGALEHKDSMGNGSVIRAGDVQRMTAGTGVRHSEFNASQDEPVHFLQIWVVPEAASLEPSYEQKHFDREDLQGKLRLVASRDGREGSVTVHQDVSLYAGRLRSGETSEHAFVAGRHGWLQVVEGKVTVQGQELAAGDGLEISDAESINVKADGDAHVLLFDLA